MSERLFKLAIALLSQPERHGLLKNDLADKLSALNYIIERASAVMDQIRNEAALQRKGAGVGHEMRAAAARVFPPTQPRQNGEERPHTAMASPTPRDERGQNRGAQRGQKILAPSSRSDCTGTVTRLASAKAMLEAPAPAAAPTPAQRQAAIDIDKQRIMKRIRFYNGVDLTKPRLSELPHYFATHERDARRSSLLSRVAKSIYDAHRAFDQNKRVGDVMTDDHLLRMFGVEEIDTLDRLCHAA